MEKNLYLNEKLHLNVLNGQTFQEKKKLKNLLAKVIFEKLSSLKKLYKKKLIFYYYYKSFLNEDCNFYLLNNIKKINL